MILNGLRWRRASRAFVCVSWSVASPQLMQNIMLGQSSLPHAHLGSGTTLLPHIWQYLPIIAVLRQLEFEQMLGIFILL